MQANVPVGIGKYDTCILRLETIHVNVSLFTMLQFFKSETSNLRIEPEELNETNIDTSSKEYPVLNIYSNRV